MKTTLSISLRTIVLMATSLLLCGHMRGAVVVDANASGDQGTAKTTVVTASFSTTSANELLLAFISTDNSKTPNTTVTKIAGGSLTWVLVQRTNVQLGTAEIWRAFATTTLSNVTVTATLSQSVASSITVMSFSGVDTTGTNGSGAIGGLGTGNANPGTPTATLVTTRNGSLVVGVGTDWDRGTARTVGSGQTLVHQYIPPVGDTYWVQMESSPTLLSGTSVTINDTAPTNDRYNLSIAEVLGVQGGGTSGSISGTITPAASGNGATLTLSQGGVPIATTTAGANGSYSFASELNGTYTVTPSAAGFTFSPANQSATVAGNTVVVPVFTATATTGAISGTITPAASGNGAAITLSQGGVPVATTTAGSNGSYSFVGVLNGAYTVTPSAAGFTFSPASQSAMVAGNTVVVPVFTATATTGTISGTITPAANGSGATVALMQAGTPIATTIAAANGSYSFAGVLNGTYTVTPSAAGFTFSPASQNATVAGNTVVVPVFTATATTGTISGTITPAANGSGATVALTQAGTPIATTIAAANGSYSFAGVLNGTYAVTPSAAGFTFSPASQNATVAGNTVVVPAFTATATTGTISGTITPAANGSGALVGLTQAGTPITTTTVGGDGSYSFAGVLNGTYAVTPSAAGFTFSPASQNATVAGNTVVVPAFTASVLTWSVAGTISPVAAGVGTSVSLTQNATLVATTAGNSSGNYSFANISNGTYTVTLSNAAFTFSPTSQMVTVSNGNLSVPVFTATPLPTWNVTGSISPVAGGSGALLTLSGAGSATTNADVSGNYTFANISNGTYTVTPSLTGFTYAPVNQQATVNGANATVAVFTATATTGTIAGTITPAASASGTKLTLSQGGTAGATATADATGTYNFANVLNGTYTVTPTLTGFTFNPASQSVTVSGGAATVPNFALTAIPTWKISGTITPTAGGSGATVTLSGGSNATTTSDASGNYNFSGNANGTYTVTPTNSGFTFTPPNQSVTVNGADQIAINFTAQSAAPPPPLKIDASVSKDQSTASATVTTAAFSTTSGNELLLAFVGSDYQPSQSSTNIVVNSVSGGGLTWQLVKRTNAQSGTAEIWRAFAPAVLSNVTVTATLSQSVQSSLTVMSFSGVDTSGTNGSGAIGATVSASAAAGAPVGTLKTTRNNSWVVAAGNDYDNATSRTIGAGQTLVHQDLAPIKDTYWVQRQTITTPLTGTNVTINDTAPTADRFNLAIAEVLPALNLSSVPDLTVSKTHTGNFSQGQTGASYTITVSNAGGVATAGTVTFTDSLPSGLTATGIAGTNWVCVLGTLTCTRNDALAAGASYPAITITVNVASNAPASITNTATVSGGGESNTANDTASDLTSITSANPSGIKRIQANVNGNESATSSMTVAFPSNVTAGDFLIVTGSAARPASTLTVSDTLGNTYIPAIGPVTDTTQNVTIYIWYVPTSLGGANTVKITPSTTAALEIHVSEWSGLSSVSPVDQTASATGTSAAVSSGAKTTSTGGQLIFGYGWVFNDASPGTGFTSISLVNGDMDEFEIQSNAGSVAATFTQTSGTWFALMATFKPVGGGTVPPSISLASPASGATVTNKTTVTANATDTSFAISGVQFLLDGVNLGAQVTAPPYALTWDTTTATVGAHTLSATVSDSGGQQVTATPITVTVDNSGNTAVVGSWSAAVSIPTVAVNLVLLKNNTLLFYEDGASPTVWDYNNNIFTNISTAADIFCSGHAALADGRILVVGGYGNGSGDIGIANAEIFDPSNNTWTVVPKMAFKRWYPGATTLSDGRILAAAGWQTTNNSNAGIPEIYDPVANTWTQLINANNPFQTYPFMFMLSDGRVIHVGGSEFATNTDILDINAQTWTVVDSRIVDGGSATMYVPGKIMKAGSAADSQNTGPSSNTTFILDTTQPSPAWVQTPSMAYARSFMNLTELPDGTVLATGGESDKNGGDITKAVFAAELWSPVTQTWTTMASMHTPREYHGTALLLPDGRVVESGMGADFGNVPDEMSAEFYSPPYLFKGPRPMITQSPAQVQYGTSFFIGTPDAASIQSAVLIRTGAVTHFFDQNTRYVPVTFQQATGGLTLTAPANALLAPPGYYMLFLVNAGGVPSIAPFVQVTP